MRRTMSKLGLTPSCSLPRSRGEGRGEGLLRAAMNMLYHLCASSPAPRWC